MTKDQMFTADLVGHALGRALVEHGCRQLQTLDEDPRDFTGPRETCVTCASDLRVGEANTCDDCLADQLTATPCVDCQQPVGDPEPPMTARGPICAVCWFALLGVA